MSRVRLDAHERNTIFMPSEVRLKKIRVLQYIILLLNCTLGPPNCTVGPPNLGVRGAEEMSQISLS